jgi:hypothetical protein
MSTSEINLRGYPFAEAKQEILNRIQEAWTSGSSLKLIHGYRGGRAIRHYLRGERLGADVCRYIPDVGELVIASSSKGTTTISFS